MTRWLKVGEIAERTGVSIRTLHHYDEIGLLVPSERGAGGHRLYTAADVSRLQQIRSLAQMGLSLEQVREVLARPGQTPLGVIRMHIDRLRENVARGQRLLERLEFVEQRLAADDEVSIEQVLEVIGEMERFEKYYTKEQLETLAKRGEDLGEGGMAKAQQDWAELIAAVQAERAKGTDPSDPKMIALGRKWAALIEAFTGGDPGITESLRRMYRDDPNVVADRGYTHDPELSAYVGKAIEAGKEGE